MNISSIHGIFLPKRHCKRKMKMVVCGCNRNIAEKTNNLC